MCTRQLHGLAHRACSSPHGWWHQYRKAVGGGGPAAAGALLCPLTQGRSHAGCQRCGHPVLLLAHILFGDFLRFRSVPGCVPSHHSPSRLGPVSCVVDLASSCLSCLRCRVPMQPSLSDLGARPMKVTEEQMKTAQVGFVSHLAEMSWFKEDLFPRAAPGSQRLRECHHA